MSKKFIVFLFVLTIFAGSYALGQSPSFEKQLFIRGGYATNLGWVGLELRYGHLSVQSGYRYVTAATSSGQLLDKRSNWNFGVNLYFSSKEKSPYIALGYGKNVFPRVEVALVDRDISWAYHYTALIGFRTKYVKRIGFKAGIGTYYAVWDRDWVKEMPHHKNFGFASEMTLGFAIF